MVALQKAAEITESIVGILTDHPTVDGTDYTNVRGDVGSNFLQSINDMISYAVESQEDLEDISINTGSVAIAVRVLDGTEDVEQSFGTSLRRKRSTPRQLGRNGAKTDSVSMNIPQSAINYKKFSKI